MSASTAAAATRGNSLILPNMIPSATASTNTLRRNSFSLDTDNGNGASHGAAAGVALATVATTAETSTTVTVAPVQKKFTGIQFSWVHFLAGGTGGMAGALVTSPLDVIKTRLQSTMYRTSKDIVTIPRTGIASVLGHVKDTCLLLGHIYSKEGPRALYKGLGPNLVGVIPARAINFAAYGNGKKFYAELNHGKESTLVHLSAAATAGVVTATMTNPIWLVKTRMQLQIEGVRQYKNSVDCIYQILKNEGIRGMYRGLSASYLGVAEGTIQWVIYEQLKNSLAQRRALRADFDNTSMKVGGKHIDEWAEFLGAAGVAKFIASAFTYPHEVLRTRLRQVPVGNELP
ncbi:hypothetical protein BGW38_010620, partial [Lunasporangiospora selenospora]